MVDVTATRVLSAASSLLRAAEQHRQQWYERPLYQIAVTTSDQLRSSNSFVWLLSQSAEIYNSLSGTAWLYYQMNREYSEWQCN